MPHITNDIKHYKLMSKCHVCGLIPTENKDKLTIITTLEEFKNKSEIHHLDRIIENFSLTPLSLDIPNDDSG